MEELLGADAGDRGAAAGERPGGHLDPPRATRQAVLTGAGEGLVGPGTGTGVWPERLEQWYRTNDSLGAPGRAAGERSRTRSLTRRGGGGGAAAGSGRPAQRAACVDSDAEPGLAAEGAQAGAWGHRGADRAGARAHRRRRRRRGPGRGPGGTDRRALPGGPPHVAAVPARRARHRAGRSPRGRGGIAGGLRRRSRAPRSRRCTAALSAWRDEAAQSGRQQGAAATPRLALVKLLRERGRADRRRAS